MWHLWKDSGTVLWRCWTVREDVCSLLQPAHTPMFSCVAANRHNISFKLLNSAPISNFLNPPHLSTNYADERRSSTLRPSGATRNWQPRMPFFFSSSSFFVTRVANTAKAVLPVITPSTVRHALVAADSLHVRGVEVVVVVGGADLADRVRQIRAK